ncbi:MAG: M15 family metallopeptidase [Candidatus Omnitrophica bacterium]|nr:M15 family metallopeptidase [Candidatus Omnitrophota bacterium]
MNKNKNFLVFIPVFFALVLSGCATVGVGPERAIERPPLGSLQNPIIDCDISLSTALRKYSPPEFKRRQRLIDVLYYSFDGKIHKGQLVIDERLAPDIREVFKVALDTRLPIQSVIPISDDRFYRNGKWNSDDQSMLANNTSAFNYRTATGSRVLSNHAYGFAIDINPVQNPYFKGRVVLPPGAVYDTSRPGTLYEGSPVVKTFKRLGWTWGGNWKTLKDYQHFEKVLPFEHPAKHRGKRKRV